MQQFSDRIIASAVPMNSKWSLACFAALERICLFCSEVSEKYRDIAKENNASDSAETVGRINAFFIAERKNRACLIRAFRLAAEYRLILSDLLPAPIGRSYVSDLESRLDECRSFLRRFDSNALLRLNRLERLLADSEMLKRLIHSRVGPDGQEKLKIKFLDLRELLALTEVLPFRGFADRLPDTDRYYIFSRENTDDEASSREQDAVFVTEIHKAHPVPVMKKYEPAVPDDEAAENDKPKENDDKDAGDLKNGLVMNAYLSEGARYFALLHSRCKKSAYLLSALVGETLAGLHKYRKHGHLLRALEILNNPPLADEYEKGLTVTSWEMLFGKMPEPADLDSMMATLPDRMRVVFLQILTYRLRAMKKQTDGVELLYEERLIKLLKAYGIRAIFVELSDPLLPELRRFFQRTPQQICSEMIGLFLSRGSTGLNARTRGSLNDTLNVNEYELKSLNQLRRLFLAMQEQSTSLSEEKASGREMPSSIDEAKKYYPDAGELNYLFPDEDKPEKSDDKSKLLDLLMSFLRSFEDSRPLVRDDLIRIIESEHTFTSDRLTELLHTIESKSETTLSSEQRTKLTELLHNIESKSETALSSEQRAKLTELLHTIESTSETTLSSEQRSTLTELLHTIESTSETTLSSEQRSTLTELLHNIESKSETVLSSEQHTKLTELLHTIESTSETTLSSEQRSTLTELLHTIESTSETAISSEQRTKLTELLHTIESTSETTLSREQRTKLTELLHTIESTSETTLSSEQRSTLTELLHTIKSKSETALSSEQRSTLTELLHTIESKSETTLSSEQRNTLTELLHTIESTSETTLSSEQRSTLTELLHNIESTSETTLSSDQRSSLTELLNKIESTSETTLSSEQRNTLTELLHTIESTSETKLSSEQRSTLTELLHKIESTSEITFSSEQRSTLTELLHKIDKRDRSFQ